MRPTISKMVMVHDDIVDIWLFEVLSSLSLASVIMIRASWTQQLSYSPPILIVDLLVQTAIVSNMQLPHKQACQLFS